jgi:IclR family pca regulon transcriptional regulator
VSKTRVIHAPVRREESRTSRQFVQGVERAFAVIRCFSADRPALTITDVAARSGLARAAARRYLLTLKELGYVAQEGSLFSLTPRVLDLGFTYLSTMSVATVARPIMERLVEALREPCSVSVLDDRDVVYIARVTPKRLVSSTLAIGSRLPAHCTSMGKVLLAAMSPDRLEAFFAVGPLKPMTDRTICSEVKLRETLNEVRARGWAWNDGESEEGVRSVAAPILDRAGKVHAAINVAGLVSRVSMKDLRGKYVAAVVEAGTAISHALGADPQRLQKRILDYDFRKRDR